MVNGIASLSGALKIQIHWHQGRIDQVGIESSRPRDITRLLCGRSMQEAVALVPRLFALCGAAQTVAAVRACEQAAGIAVPDTVEQARNWLVLGETARELGWRLLRDWISVDDSQLEQSLGRWSIEFHQALQPALALGARAPGALVFAGNHIATLATLLQQLRAQRECEALPQWMEERFGDTPLGPGVPPLPEFTDGWLERQLSGPEAGDFCQAPHWQGQARETSLYTRLHPQPKAGSISMAQRLQALIMTLKTLPEQMHQAGAERLLTPLGVGGGGVEGIDADGIGYGVVEAARGRLLHRVALADGRVLAYRIVAPTEWNFHTRGVIPRTLEGVELARDQVQPLVKALVLAVDPCVVFEIAVNSDEAGSNA